MNISESNNYYECTNFDRNNNYDKNYSLSTNFKLIEFQSHVNGRDYAPNIIVSKDLIAMLEKFFPKLGCNRIYISSGYRTPDHSVSVGGYRNDQHTKGTAADIICYIGETKIDSKDVCCAAQDLGFNGIGYGKSYTHVDVRSGKWWGDETNGNNVTDFFEYFGKESGQPDPGDSPDRAAAENYVRTCYIEYLGQNADLSGMENHTDILLNGGSESEVDNAIFGSDEYKAKFIKSCFRNLMGNEATSNDIARYMSYGRLRDICCDISYSLPDENYIRTCFIEYLDRDVDAEGLHNYMNYINDGASEADIANSVMGSLEYRHKFIKSCCRILLGRESSSYDITRYSSLGRLRDICESVTRNANYENYARTCFIEFLGRNADLSGLHNYTDMLINGSSEFEVDNAFYGSLEYKQKFIKACFTNLLGKTASISDIDYYSSFGRLRDICLDIFMS